MNTIEIPEIGIYKEIPSQWSEMSSAQICEVMRLIWKLEHGEISPIELHIQILYSMLGIRRDARTIAWERLHPEDAECKNANIAQLCVELLGWIFEQTDAGMIPTFNGIENPLPVIKSGAITLIGPMCALQDLTLVEFRTALVARDNFLKTKDHTQLNVMIASLYRRRSKTINKAGRHVGSISHDTFDYDIIRAGRISGWQKQTILLWFSSCVRFIQNGTINYNGENMDMQAIFRNDKSTSAVQKDALTWTDVIYEIAKDRALGTMNDIDTESLYLILSIMYHNVKQARRNEKNR